ncbi:MAG: hypothetical protein R2874_12300 [Desulfobacterales bacterium]
MNQSSKKAADSSAARPTPVTVITGYLNYWAIDYFTRHQFNVARFDANMFAVRTLQNNFEKTLPQGSIEGHLLFLWPNAWVRSLNIGILVVKCVAKYIDGNTIKRQFSCNLPVYVPLDERYAHIGCYIEKISGAVKLSDDPLVFH